MGFSTPDWGLFPYPVFAIYFFFISLSHSAMCVRVCACVCKWAWQILSLFSGCSMPCCYFYVFLPHFRSIFFLFCSFSRLVDISFDSQLSSFVLYVDSVRVCVFVCVRVLIIVICTRVCRHTNANCLPVISGHLSCLSQRNTPSISFSFLHTPRVPFD